MQLWSYLCPGPEAAVYLEVSLQHFAADILEAEAFVWKPEARFNLDLP